MIKKCDEPKLGHMGIVILYVKKPLKSLIFYRDVLGLTARTQSPRWVELETGGTVLALHAHDDIPSVKPESMPEVVFHVQDIQETFVYFKERGVKFVQTLRPVHQSFGVIGMAAQFRDPDGNILSIYGTLESNYRPL